MVATLAFWGGARCFPP
ncbi:hypothetical protein Golob_018660 [Gossypium lobatum]|uniref:Uncharacterized protein n=1 Tax=Gossypium lobatum TaxID=34289 RepID=A0A7J8MB07_9ROSI|nr:hypothetical protein [Gossypium lobatum]